MKKKRTRSYAIKHFTWWAVFIIPISYFIGRKFGFDYQCAFNFGVIVTPLISILAEYCNEKF